MKLTDIKAHSRTATGNGPARGLRREGKIPAVLYGSNTESASLSLVVKDLEEVMKESQTSQILVNLSIDDGKPQPALLKALQRHPVTGAFLHADFYQVDMARKIRVNVPVTTKGKCIGIEMGGMLQIIRRELEVLCLPNRIPGHIEIDITNLEMGESFHVEDLVLEDGIEVPHEVNFTVLTVVSGRMKAEEAEEEGVEEEIEGEEPGEEAEAETPEGATG
ncbi:MAG: 50S ribosomal protein L25/general stress protein Ctc [Desulfobacterales bacterium]